MRSEGMAGRRGTDGGMQGSCRGLRGRWLEAMTRSGHGWSTSQGMAQRCRAVCDQSRCLLCQMNAMLLQLFRLIQVCLVCRWLGHWTGDILRRRDQNLGSVTSDKGPRGFVFWEKVDKHGSKEATVVQKRHFTRSQVSMGC